MPEPSDDVGRPRGEDAAISEVKAPPRIGRYRWIICALLFFATTINYLDRQVLGILASPLQ
jgi:MFS transporter, ACS family, hexuronate transporter